MAFWWLFGGFLVGFWWVFGGFLVGFWWFRWYLDNSNLTPIASLQHTPTKAIVLDSNSLFIENVIFIMKNILEDKADQQNDQLGVFSIESLMLTIVRCSLPNHSLFWGVCCLGGVVVLGGFVVQGGVVSEGFVVFGGWC